MHKSIKKIVSLLLVLAIAATFAFANISEVEAATRVTTQKVSTKITYNFKGTKFRKAPAVKKGTTIVTLAGRKGAEGLVKFKAPKTKVYKITISNCVGTKGDDINGHFYIYRENKGMLDFMTLNTQGGRNNKFQVANKKFLKIFYKYSNHDKPRDEYRTSRTVTVKLNKNQVIYINGSFAVEKGQKSQFTLKIK